MALHVADAEESLAEIAGRPGIGEALAPPPLGAAVAEPIDVTSAQPRLTPGETSRDQDAVRHCAIAIKRDLLILQDHIDDLEARFARLEPLLRIGSLVSSGLRGLRGAFSFALAVGGSAYRWRDAAKKIEEARIRSERLVFDPIGESWARKIDWRAFARHLRFSFGLLRPTLYRVRPRQRLALARRPRVLHAIANVWVGGSTQLVVDLHDHLGHRIEMEVMTSALPPYGAHRGMAITLIPKPAARHVVRRAFSRFRPDIVHVHYWGDVDEPWYRIIFEVAAEFGCPILQNVNTPVAPFADVPIDRNIFVSQSVFDRFGSTAPASVIYPGADLDRFAPPAVANAHAFDAIGMVYRLEHDKLNEDSIELFIAIVKRRPRTRVIVIGDGSLFAHFRSRAAKEGLLSQFEFAGFVPYEELPAQLARFKIFVAPVHQESFGQVVPFAMCAGLAVAGYRAGAVPEILGSTETLAETLGEATKLIVDLLDDRDRIIALGERNRALALARFSVERMAVSYLNVYRDLAPGSVDFLPGLPDALHFPL